MTMKPLLGLLECPLHSGWMEFEFHQGDKISDLVESINAKWGGEIRLPYESIRATSWVFFCEQLDSDYLALLKNDLIPTEAPGATKRATITYPDHPRGALEIYHLDHGLWNSSHGPYSSIPIEMTENFSIDLSLQRNYDRPPDKEYDVRLVALVAIVGG